MTAEGLIARSVQTRDLVEQRTDQRGVSRLVARQRRGEDPAGGRIDGQVQRALASEQVHERAQQTLSLALRPATPSRGGRRPRGDCLRRHPDRQVSPPAPRRIAGHPVLHTVVGLRDLWRRGSLVLWSIGITDSEGRFYTRSPSRPPQARPFCTNAGLRQTRCGSRPPPQGAGGEAQLFEQDLRTDLGGVAGRIILRRHLHHVGADHIESVQAAQNRQRLA